MRRAGVTVSSRPHGGLMREGREVLCTEPGTQGELSRVSPQCHFYQRACYSMKSFNIFLHSDQISL